jgi:hypothetical protein
LTKFAPLSRKQCCCDRKCYFSALPHARKGWGSKKKWATWGFQGAKGPTTPSWRLVCVVSEGVFPPPRPHFCPQRLTLAT